MRRGLAVLAFLGAFSCAPTTARLRQWQPPTASQEGPGYRFSHLSADGNSDSLFICLTFSGGGTRASAFAYGVMQALRDTTVSWQGQEKRLLDEVDCISSVSGGSFTAAYYGLFHDDLFQHFRDRFLYRNIQRRLLLQALNPLNWFRLASPYFSRIDLAAELYDTEVFDHRRFDDLVTQARKPFIILNATNIATGDRFPFTQDQFDLIGSDLGPYAVARAVAASSAFPFLLSPLTLQNYQPIPGYTPPLQYTNALNDYYNNPNRYYWARSQLAYVQHPYPYVHLMDGGLADNIGLRAVMNAYEQSDGFISRKKRNIERLVIIVVNARTETPDSISRHRHTPHIIPTVALATATISMNNYSFETIDAARRLMSDVRAAQQAHDDCQNAIDSRCANAKPLPPLAARPIPYVIEVNFDGLPADRRDGFLQLPTSFHLSHAQVDELVAAGCELLEQNPTYRQLLADLDQKAGGGSGPRASVCTPAPHELASP